MAGKQLIDMEVPDHNGHTRRQSELAAGDPLAVNFHRGWWCPKEQAFFRRLVALQDEAEVAYTRLVSIGIDPPEVAAAFRAGLDARWTFLSDRNGATRASCVCSRPRTRCTGRTCPASFTLHPDLRIHAAYNGYRFWAPAHQRAATQRSTRDHPCDPAGLGATVMTGWCWFALVEADLPRSLTDAALATAPAIGPAGDRLGTFAAWPAGRKPVREALRTDARLVDPQAPAAWGVPGDQSRGTSRRCSTTSPSSRRYGRCCARRTAERGEHPHSGRHHVGRRPHRDPACSPRLPHRPARHPALRRQAVGDARVQQLRMESACVH
jgi:peroxiredoxin